MRLGPFDVPGFAIGDSRDLLRQLPDESVHCVVTSPPYWGLRDYGLGTDQLGLEATPDEYVTHMVELFRDVRRVLRSDGTLWLNLGDTYIAHVNGNKETSRNSGLTNPTRQFVCTSSVRKAKTLRDNLGQHMHADLELAPNRRPIEGLKNKDLVGIPWRVALALQADGWWLRLDNIWHKKNPTPESCRDRPTRAHEYVFLMAKSERYFYDRVAVMERTSGTANPRGNGVNQKARQEQFGARQNSSFAAAVRGLVAMRNKRSVWSLTSRPYKEAHHATFPPELPEVPILAGTSPRVCGVCSAPWERLTEEVMVETPRGGPLGKQLRRYVGRDERQRRASGERGELQIRTTGWEPTCEHRDETGRAIVLDPFLGSGTTAEVAEKHGRLWLGFDKDPKNEPLIRKRTRQQSLPMPTEIT